MGYAIALMFGAMQSGKIFRDRGKTVPEYSLFIGPPLSDDGAVQASPQSEI